MITKGMIKVLRLIAQEADNREKISRELGLSKTWISDNLSKLEKLRFIIKKRKGKALYLELAETSFAQEFKNVIENSPHIRFEDFLYGLNFKILSYCLFGWKTSQSIANQLKLSKKTIWNRLIILTSRGLLIKKRKFYLTNKKAWSLVYNFLEKYRMFYLGAGKILWRFEDELVFCVTKEKDVNGSLTGFTQYPKLGVAMRGVKICCYLPKKKLTKEEIFIHSFLEVSDSRELMLVLVFYLKHKLNKRKLEDLAMKYDCLEKFKDIMRILNHEKPKIFSLIKERELKEFFEIYRVKWN